MDQTDILPSKETFRCFLERGTALYEQGQGRKKRSHDRDISEYQVNESAPTELYVKGILTYLLELATKKPDKLEPMRAYIQKWTTWLFLELSTVKEFERSVQILMPSLFSCLRPHAAR